MRRKDSSSGSGGRRANAQLFRHESRRRLLPAHFRVVEAQGVLARLRVCEVHVFNPLALRGLQALLKLFGYKSRRRLLPLHLLVVEAQGSVTRLRVGEMLAFDPLRFLVVTDMLFFC